MVELIIKNKWSIDFNIKIIKTAIEVAKIDFSAQLVRAKSKIGKYKGLLEMSQSEFEDYENKIKKILNEK